MVEQKLAHFQLLLGYFGKDGYRITLGLGCYSFAGKGCECVGVRGEEKGKEKEKNVFGGHVHQKQK